MTSPSRDPFWSPESIEELAERQGVQAAQDLTALIGAGKDLWESDEELDEFLEGVKRRRTESRSPADDQAAPGAA